MGEVWLLGITELVLLGTLWLNLRGHSQLAALMLNETALVCGAALVFMSGAGYRDVSLLLFPAIPVIAALLLPRRYYWPMSAAVVLVAGVLILLQIHGLNPHAPPTGGYTDLIAAVVILVNISVVAGYLVVTLGASRRFSQATIDALPEEICVLDDNAEVLAVNQSWRRFAETNPRSRPMRLWAPTTWKYAERLTVRRKADANAFAAGLRAVLRGEREEIEWSTPATPEGRSCCFSAHVTRFPGQGEARR